MTRSPFAGVRKAKPTRAHRPAVWEMLLGTVYASDGQTVRYFDYDWDGAKEFAGVTDTADLRLARYGGGSLRGDRGTMAPRKGQLVLFVKD